MRKYAVLRIILQASSGITPLDISRKLGTSLPNIYAYLKELSEEKLVSRTAEKKYLINNTNEKTEQILALQAMVPAKFHKLISPDFKGILEKLCAHLKVGRAALSVSDVGKIEKLAIPLRIVLKISKRPAAYSLKLNEALVAVLLSYHDLKPNFDRVDFQKMIDELHLRRSEQGSEIVKSDSEVVALCDKLYESGGDDFISKTADFVPDERLAELLKAADQANKEYALFLNALDKNTRATLEDQWEKRYIYNTNSIEGNTMSENDVNDFLKTGKTPERMSKREIFETNNMHEALRFLKLKRNEDVSEELAKELHFLIQKNIEEKPGNYKNFYNYVNPSSPTTPPQHVRQRMAMLTAWYKGNRDRLHPFVLASTFHIQFEVIHPFGDGNGRVGRLLTNHILAQKNYFPVTILEKTKQNYYRALENRSLPQFLFYALSSFIEEYKR